MSWGLESISRRPFSTIYLSPYRPSRYQGRKGYRTLVQGPMGESSASRDIAHGLPSSCDPRPPLVETDCH